MNYIYCCFYYPDNNNFIRREYELDVDMSYMHIMTLWFV
jgi:hypothetical protein